ncbi:MAG: ABC transporter permease, partial [Gammaproteobacteria bacterium]|nr:ABC transporter permease [Gammaproteobacteria bacterium]
FLMRCMDIILAFPWLLIVIAVIAILGPSIPNAMIAIGITLIPEFARLTRSLVLAARSQDFVLAAKSLGASRLRIAVRHVMPHCIAQLVVLSTVRLGRAILSEAGLSYLGLGVQPPHPSWGSMIASGQDYLLTSPHASLVPGLAVLVVVMALNIAGDGLRDALDPKGVR